MDTDVATPILTGQMKGKSALGLTTMLLTGILGAACSEPTKFVAPAETFHAPAGYYHVISRDGLALPAQLSDSAGWTRILTFASFSIWGNALMTDELYSVVFRSKAGQRSTAGERTDGPGFEMLTKTSFRITGLNFLVGTGTVESDSIIVVQSDSTATFGKHVWRLKKQKYVQRSVERGRVAGDTWAPVRSPGAR